MSRTTTTRKKTAKVSRRAGTPSTVSYERLEEFFTKEELRYFTDPSMTLEGAPEEVFRPYMRIMDVMRRRLREAISIPAYQGSAIDSVANTWVKVPEGLKYPSLSVVFAGLAFTSSILAMPLLLLGVGGVALIMGCGYVLDKHARVFQGRLQVMHNVTDSIVDVMSLMFTSLLQIGERLRRQVNRFAEENARLTACNNEFVAKIAELGQQLDTMQQQVLGLAREREALSVVIAQAGAQTEVAHAEQSRIQRQYVESIATLEHISNQVPELFQALEQRATEAETQRGQLDNLLMQMMQYQRRQTSNDRSLRAGLEQALGENNSNFVRIVGEFAKNKQELARATQEITLRTQELERTQQAYRDLNTEYRRLTGLNQEMYQLQRREMERCRETAKDLKEALSTQQAQPVVAKLAAQGLPGSPPWAKVSQPAAAHRVPHATFKPVVVGCS